MSVKSLDTVINLEKLENEKNNQNGELIKTRLRIKSGSNDRLFKTLSNCEDYNGVITISELEKDIRDSSKSTKVSLYLAMSNSDCSGFRMACLEVACLRVAYME